MDDLMKKYLTEAKSGKVYSHDDIMAMLKEQYKTIQQTMKRHSVMKDDDKMAYLEGQLDLIDEIGGELSKL